MRRPKPYFKSSHNAWNANIGPNRRPLKLAEGRDNEEAAWSKYDVLMAGRQPLNGDCRVVDLVQKFVDWHRHNSSQRTYDFYFEPLESFLQTLPANMRVADLRPYHVTQWVDTRKMAKRGRKVKGTKGTYRNGRHGPPHRPEPQA